LLLGTTYDTLTALVDVFEAKLDCEVATISPSDQPSPGENTLPDTPSQSTGGRLSTAQYLEGMFTLRTRSCPDPLYLSFTGPKTFAFNGSSCGDAKPQARKTKAVDRFVAIWGHRERPTDEDFIPDLGVVCVPSYAIRKGNVLFDTVAKFGAVKSDFPASPAESTLDGITAWDILTEFVRSAVESTDAIFQGDHGSLEGKTGTGLESLIQTAISEGRAADRIEALSKVFGLVTAQVANQYLKDAAQIPITGSIFTRERRLVVSAVSFWLLEAMLLILSLIAGYLIVLSPKVVTPCDASTLAGLSTVLARSDSALSSIVGTGKASEKVLVNHIKNVEFRTDILIDSNGQHVFRIESNMTDEASPLLIGAGQQKETLASTKSRSWNLSYVRIVGRFIWGIARFPKKTTPASEIKEGRYQPFSVTIAGRTLLLLALPALILTLELLYQRSERDDGLAEIDNNSGAAHYAWTYTPTAVMVGMGLWLTALSSTVKLLGPYTSLWRGMAPADSTMTENYLHSIAIQALWKAARKKKWGIATAGLASMLTPFLTIVASGLLSARPSMTSTTASFRRTDSFRLDPTNTSTGLTFANLALASNLSDPLYVGSSSPPEQVHGPNCFLI
jgi:hypothetical protein